MELMQGTYQPSLVLLSLFIAAFASYAAFHAAGRLGGSTSRKKILWAIAGGFCLGGGIWSMHFIGMLAYDMGMSVTYDPVLFALSVTCAVTASCLAFLIVQFFQPKLIFHLIGSVLIGAGIVSMHYIGMASMQMGAELIYDYMYVALSVLIGLAASFSALRLLSALPSIKHRGKREAGFIGSAIVMGAAISGLHYTGMEGTYFLPGDGVMSPSSSSFLGSELLSVLISMVVMMILTITIIVAVFTGRVESSQNKSNYLEDLYQSIIHSATDAIVTADKEGTIISWNAAAERIFGHSKEDVIGHDLTVIIPESYRDAHNAGFTNHQHTGEEKLIGSVVELEGLHKNGRTFPIELSLSKQGRDKTVYFTGIIRDISERVEQNERIQELVYRDELTRLPNRRMLNEHLQHMLDQKAVSRIAVLFIDLDRFKNVNDVFGHRIGDELLISASQRMNEELREEDFIARQSGDEFVAVLPNATQYQAVHTAQSLIQSLKRSFLVENHELFVTASIGISIYPQNGRSAEELIQYADTAMYQSKSNGQNQYCFFTPDMNEEVSKKLLLESDLRKGLKEGQFQLYYQPQVSVASGEVKGYEALIRWEHPEYGMVSPGDFIPLAEETGLIIPLGRWVLEEACRQMMAWIKDGGGVLRMSVNISAIQFQQPDFVQIVKDILAETGLPPAYLELEMTETIVQDTTQSIPVMKEIRDMGVKISLDDFGTGYSSLSYLKDFPLNTLKIDKSFIDNMEQGSREKAIVDAIIHMAHRLEFNVIAEGIENEAQLQLLSGEACEEYQGYYYSPPLPSSKIEK
ncbi:bifunctional diguanylate cyclase/phosphodiesterase [Salibacterium qingdaonense]|uniref:PAS domain S-box-containing protein/diguanylate cyclase (GGDEF) domain-containing protein n=1 Tax=Salibacterium qingdaonense TaxID=266892 RepID=A0A1I4KIV9_9BACI|nr:bifunctional diguanylate cyclase/phosphodiesterase [Salibacterium qingdaonense]SFL78549.1 PAS domain S-box-containing protein/diguanylate cyclase (GGDEF) domain-containing protein [Salibacterium qingdaonense]